MVDFDKNKLKNLAKEPNVPDPDMEANPGDPKRAAEELNTAPVHTEAALVFPSIGTEGAFFAHEKRREGPLSLGAGVGSGRFAMGAETLKAIRERAAREEGLRDLYGCFRISIPSRVSP
jgi:hypothetical protein